jgi:hypothetical protein
VIDIEVERLLGPTVADLLRDPRCQEVSANYDIKADAGRIFVDYGEGPMCATGTDIASDAIKPTAAASNGRTGGVCPDRRL